MNLKSVWTRQQLLVILTLINQQIFIQINRTIFSKNFKNASTIPIVWGPANNYSVSTGQTGNGILFKSLTSNGNISVYIPISLTNLRGSTISSSASIK